VKTGALNKAGGTRDEEGNTSQMGVGMRCCACAGCDRGGGGAAGGESADQRGGRGRVGRADRKHWSNHPEGVQRTWVSKEVGKQSGVQRLWFNLEFDLSPLFDTP